MPAPVVSPESTSASPLANVVLVGYQRLSFMSGSWMNDKLVGSNKRAWGKPTWLETWPPAYSTFPSGSSEWPPQKMLYGGTGSWLSWSVAGSHRKGGPAPSANSPMNITLPFGSNVE